MSSSGTRRAHQKSRKGCQTCKTRKVKCDEFFPQCRNCTKRSIRCAYMDDPAASEGSSASEKLAEFTWPDEIVHGVDGWQSSKFFPFPHMRLTHPPNPDTLSTEECRLMYHVCDISRKLELADCTKFTTWTHKLPVFIKLATEFEYDMQALVSLSATHLALTVKSAALDQIAFVHRGKAFKSLSQAVGNLTEENADAVLGASIMLSWQSPGWRAWAALMQGIKTLKSTMFPWAAQSQFQEYLVDNMYEVGVMTPYRSRLPGHEDLGLLEGSLTSLESAMEFVSGEDEQVKGLRQLLDFVDNLRISPPGPNPLDQFKALHPLRAWVIWLPVTFLNVTSRSLRTMVTLAHFYAVTLAVQLKLPAPGPAYYPKMRMDAIEALAAEIASLSVNLKPDGIDRAMALMKFPCEIAAHFRGRLHMTGQVLGVSNDPPWPAENLSVPESVDLAARNDFDGSM